MVRNRTEGATPPEETTETTAGSQQTQAEAEPVRTVRYVINRPYSAGETPDIVTASVVGRHEDPDVLDLAYGDTQVQRVRRSNRQEPGTWHEEGA